MKFLVIGESCKDIFVYGETNRLCPEGPAPVFNPLFSTTNGGMARNVQKNIISMNVSCDIHTNNNWEDVKKTRYIDYNFNHLFLRVDEHDDTIRRTKELETIDYSNYEAIIISDYNKSFLTENDIEYIGAQHKNVFLDTKKHLYNDWCSNIRYIKINNFEYERTKHTLSDNIYEKLIVTLGAEGCLYRDETYPVPKVEMKDSSGAGDTFIAALVIKYLEANNIVDAIRHANLCATEVVQKRGAAIMETKE